MMSMKGVRMRLTRPALTAVIGGAAAITIAAGCGQSPRTIGAEPSLRVPSASLGVPAVSTLDSDTAMGPSFSVLQVRALHYIIDKRVEDGRSLQADVTVYNDGRIVVTSTMDGAGSNPRGWISVRLSDLAGKTLWSNAWSPRFCAEPPCASAQKTTWTFKTRPSVTTQAANLWLKLDIR
jgi:hypothetical protein